MAKHSRQTLTKAEARYRELVAELKMLTMSFPHLREAIDKDELPISFILKQGADRAKANTNVRRRRKA